MRKLLVHATISCITFVTSVYITNVWKWLTRHENGAPKIERQVLESDSSLMTAEQELLEIFRNYGAAQTRQDRAFFERVEADDFILFSQYGNPLTRTEDIQWMMDSPANVVYTLDVLDMKFYGNVAVIKAQMTAITLDGDRDIWPSIDICVKRNGRWQILSTTQFNERTLKNLSY